MVSPTAMPVCSTKRFKASGCFAVNHTAACDNKGRLLELILRPSRAAYNLRAVARCAMFIAERAPPDPMLQLVHPAGQRESDRARFTGEVKTRVAGLDDLCNPNSKTGLKASLTEVS